MQVVSNTFLIMAESSGRAMARNLNIRITATLGVLLKAKHDGQIPSLDAEMDRLVKDAGFFVSDRVRNTFLAESGERRENNQLDPSMILKICSISYLGPHAAKNQGFPADENPIVSSHVSRTHFNQRTAFLRS